VGSELEVGDSRKERVAENLIRTQIVQYAGASGDYNPIHTDEIYTTEIAGYPSVFAHGMLTMGLTGKVLTNWLGADRLTKFGVRFTNQVWPGDTLDSTATVTAVHDGVVELEVVTVNQEGKEVLRGYAQARIEG
jgi:acyl dehydratase